MSSSNRLVGVLSTLWILSGCIDPQGRLQEFADRTQVGDGGVTTADAAESSIADVTGDFLIAIRIYFLPTSTVQLLSTQTLTMNGDGTGQIDFHLQFLSVADRTPVGDPIDVTGVAVSKAGEFTLTKDSVTIPAAANPVGIVATVTNEQFIGTTQSADFMCGVVHGHVVEVNMDLEGGEPANPTTWGGVRVSDTANLPDAIPSCAEGP